MCNHIIQTINNMEPKDFLTLTENDYQELEAAQPRELINMVKRLKINFSDNEFNNFHFPHWNERTQSIIRLPETIFDLCTEIPENYVLHVSNQNHNHLFSFCNYNNICYLVPNNNNPDRPNIKYIERTELNKAWKHLVITGQITRDEFNRLCPFSYRYGTCSFNVFVGLINYIFPDSVDNFAGTIKFIEQE